MINFGYKLMSEEHGPSALVENAQRAEAAGFDFAAISDHYHPWLASHGHSPYAWTVLGAIAAQTSRIGLASAVTCPTIRYHPAVIAQAAATVAAMSGGRFALGLGAGERLNEHVVGTGWPPAWRRHEMLGEAIDIIRRLWQGGSQSFAGRYFTVDSARIYDLPPTPPPILVAIGGPRSARLAAARADGIFATEPKRDLVEAWRSFGGTGSRYIEVTLGWAPTEEEGRRIAHERFRFGRLGWKVLADLPNVGSFEAASRFVRPEDVAEEIPCGPDVERHVAAVGKAIEAGFDHIVLVFPGRDQQGALGFWESELRPALRGSGMLRDRPAPAAARRESRGRARRPERGRRRGATSRSRGTAGR